MRGPASPRAAAAASPALMQLQPLAASALTVLVLALASTAPAAAAAAPASSSSSSSSSGGGGGGGPGGLMVAVTNRDVEGGVVVDADEERLYTQTAADCRAACLNNSAAGCNLWVFCPSPSGCLSGGTFENQRDMRRYRQCWLKTDRKPANPATTWPRPKNSREQGVGWISGTTEPNATDRAPGDSTWNRCACRPDFTADGYGFKGTCAMLQNNYNNPQFSCVVGKDCRNYAYTREGVPYDGCSESRQCVSYLDTDLDGQVLNNGEWNYLDSPDDCCSQCGNTKQCNTWTWCGDPRGCNGGQLFRFRQCWLKQADDPGSPRPKNGGYGNSPGWKRSRRCPGIFMSALLLLLAACVPQVTPQSPTAATVPPAAAAPASSFSSSSSSGGGGGGGPGGLMVAVTNRDVEGGVVVDADEERLYTQTAADCRAACLNNSAAGCNLWVFCPSPAGCRASGISQAQQDMRRYRQCWLKTDRKPANPATTWPRPKNSREQLVGWISGTTEPNATDRAPGDSTWNRCACRPDFTADGYGFKGACATLHNNYGLQQYSCVVGRDCRTPNFWLEGQPYDGCVEAHQCVAYLDTDLDGQVLNNGEWNYLDSPDDCCSQCSLMKQCNTWTWCGDPRGCNGGQLFRFRQCWLKQADDPGSPRPKNGGGYGNSSGWISGVRQAWIRQ
ncbi:hypothetical protein HYH02_000968 [Chlamydomonas schloesseri]|uniref:Apple domain-containing protein n=1 Tax=Chlamydomonas schloesseri TaxID=2026947 RepID=A0A836BE11_9CHLO|nr:hypothetical protein HYH02_000968 [Chlamydomonas schloesseri]|eukprot:KAG2455150.1 hypothetical protein HYH02_000968 [Chlamydomonas schloesseri]